jgi:acyl-CoA thioester hydrolase
MDADLTGEKRPFGPGNTAVLGIRCPSVRLFSVVRHTIQLRVRYADTDAAGIVHYAHYLAYLEVARAEALRGLGVAPETIAAFSLAATVVEAKLQYRAPARFDDLLDVGAGVTGVSDTRFHWAYEIRRNGDGQLVLSAETEHCWSDGERSLRSCAIPAWAREALQQLDDSRAT